MIAVDTSSMIAFLEGARGADTDVVQSALEHQQLVLPPVVLTELLSDPGLTKDVRTLLAALPLLEIEPGFWERAGTLRASILKSSTPDMAELKDIVKDILQDDQRATEIIRRMLSLLKKAPFELNRASISPYLS